MVQQDYEKKPKGWYGTRVREMDEEFRELKDEVAALRAELAEQHELKKLRDHPMLVNYESFYERFRQVERKVQVFFDRVTAFEARFASIERAVRSLTAPRNRGG